MGKTVLLVQGTWGDDDKWWKPGNGSFADAVVAAGHTLVNGRPFEWSCDIGGIGFGQRDLRAWIGCGNHLYDRLDPPQGNRVCDPADLVIIGHSHARQGIRFALHLGLRADTVIFVCGPIRKDVDALTTGARRNCRRMIQINGGKGDHWRRIGGWFDGRLGVGKCADSELLEFPDADHTSLLINPTQYQRVIDLI
jgi:hypothetical protein